MEKPTIKILATGGTIAGKASSSTQTTGYVSGEFSIEELVEEIPSLSDLAKLKYEQVFNVDSVDLDSDKLVELAKLAQLELNKPDIDGIVITHGTDTMEETAFFLNLVLDTDKPVVIVGAMRPATALSADGPLNLYNAIKVATDIKSFSKGVLVVMNDQITSARYVRKMNGNSVEAFQAPIQGHIGSVVGYQVHYYYNTIPQKHMIESEFHISAIKNLPSVHIYYGYQGDDGKLLDAVNPSMVSGLIYLAPGGSSIGQNIEEKLIDIQNNGIPVVKSSRLPSGIVVESDDSFIFANTLSPNQSRILLSLVLTKTSNYNKIQNYFNKY